MMENGSEVKVQCASRGLRMILAGDIGGTKSVLGLFETSSTGRPTPRAVRSFATPAFPGVIEMLSAFATDSAVGGAAVRTACFGVAGPVLEDSATLTNVGWHIHAQAVAHAFDIERVVLLNDLEAMAYAVPALAPQELYELQKGEAAVRGNRAVIAPGTGLGQALLHSVDGRFVAVALEGGHADWAARSERDIALLRDLTQRYGRAEVEHILSGPGLVNLFRITHAGPCLAVEDETNPDAPAAITSAALQRRCHGCVEALQIFVDALGAEAGNLALRTMATAGLFIGGGIPPKILSALSDGRFLRAFLDKGAMRGLLERMPVRVILNQDAGLLGAAVFASDSPR